MEDFPGFMKNRKNRIRQSSQYTQDIEGYVFDGADGSQVAYWTCFKDRVSAEHVHEYDEYLVCVHGQYMVIMNGERFVLCPGNELFIPKGVAHSGECVAGTRTIHVFGGRRAEREPW
jgi:quercetin dioxygenase-like cupin family protein